jgi:hypothetical protein
MLAKTIGYIPDIFAAVYILAFGWLIAKALEFMFSQFLRGIHFDSIAEKTGINEILSKGKTKFSASAWFGRLMFWLSMLTAFAMAFERLRIRVASDSLNGLLALFTGTVSAVVVLTLGMFLSIILSRIVETTAKSLNISRPFVYGGIVRWAVLVFTLILALAQLHIRGEFVLIALGIVFATLCATFIFAFGIGGRQWASKVLDKLY